MDNQNVSQAIRWILRIGVAGTFLGHGANAMEVKAQWIPLLTVYGFSVETAKMLMPVIGMLDILLAVIVLIRPFKIILVWAVLWTLATAVTRVIAGEEIWEFIERSANWTVPLVLLVLLDAKEYEKEIVIYIGLRFKRPSSRQTSYPLSV